MSDKALEERLAALPQELHNMIYDHVVYVDLTRPAMIDRGLYET